jgi:hypothetical protein
MLLLQGMNPDRLFDMAHDIQSKEQLAFFLRWTLNNKFDR